MKYKVVRGSSIRNLEIETNEHISLGWVALGGFTCIAKDPEFGNKQSYGQAIILIENMTKR